MARMTTGPRQLADQAVIQGEPMRKYVIGAIVGALLLGLGACNAHTAQTTDAPDQADIATRFQADLNQLAVDGYSNNLNAMMADSATLRQDIREIRKLGPLPNRSPDQNRHWRRGFNTWTPRCARFSRRQPSRTTTQLPRKPRWTSRTSTSGTPTGS